MIKVFFDHQKFSTQRYGGISRYFANIIYDIKTKDQFDYQIGCLYSPNHYIKTESQLLNNGIGRSLLNSKYGSKTYALNQQYCKYLLKADHFDVFHPTYYDPYFIGRTKKPVVITIHDMTHERLPEYFWSEDQLTRNKRRNIEVADRVIAISETTKADLIKYSNVDPKKIDVIYHGIDIDKPLDFAPVDDLPARYVLYVGDRGGYKNFYRFLDAFKHLSLKYSDVEMLLTGGGSIQVADRELISRLDLQDKIKHLNVTDEQLNFLYKNAIAFVYPSLHEGFGLPILEAFKAECPVILSDTECFREIGADAVDFFETYQVESLVASMEKLLNDAAYRTELIGRGLKRLHQFPLDISLEKTFKVYESLM
ncbi:MAG TPA: glycosyltransferase family 1 protein [Pedobacter sp.]|nr:glycosyltransferase family 1 protein [Pedobacter sp.]